MIKSYDKLYGVKQFKWNEDKNKLLLRTRGVGFEDIIKAFDTGNVIGNIDHPNKKKFPGQRLFIVSLNKYIYAVPYVENDVEISLKTIYPSRK